MKSYAKYRGESPCLGAEPGKSYEITLKCGPGEGASYIWVEIPSLPGYMMPYLSIGTLLTDWEFECGYYYDRAQDGLKRRWINTYAPAS